MKKVVKLLGTIVFACMCLSAFGLLFGFGGENKESQKDLNEIQTMAFETAWAEYVTATVESSPTPNPSMTPAQTPTQDREYGQMENPFPIKEPSYLHKSSGGDDGYVYVSVTDVIRGELANNVVKNANMFNDLPPQGTEYILINVNIKLESGYASVNDCKFDIVSKGTVFGCMDAFAASLEDVGYPKLDSVLGIPGQISSGWVVRIVFSDDINPLMAVSLDTGVNNATFWSLTP